ncbi:MAG: ABC transporter substrate-binding protein [Candidatus Binatia bacterium]
MADIRIGHLSTAYHTALVAMGRKSLEKRGLAADWQLFGTGPPIVKGLEEGKLDVGYIGLPPTTIGIARGAKIKCVAGGHEEGTVFIALSKYLSAYEAGSISGTLKQFIGKAIGSPARGSIHDVILRYFLLREGMDDKVDVRNYAWTDFMIQAMEEGEIEAAVGTPSLQVSLSLVAGLDIKPMVSPHELWPHNPSYGIIATEAFMRDHPERLLEFLRVHKESINFIRSKPEDAARISSAVMGVVGPEFFTECYKVSPRYCAALPEAYVRSTMEFVDALEEQGYIARKVEREEIFDTSFIEQIHPEPHHYDSLQASSNQS